MIQQRFEFGFCDERPANKAKVPPAKRRPVNTQRQKPPEPEKIRAPGPSHQQLQERIRELKSSHENVLKRCYEQEKKISDLQLHNQLLRAVMDDQKTSKGPMPADMLLRLIRLCHPDRHGNSEAANNATAWLLAQRKT